MQTDYQTCSSVKDLLVCQDRKKNLRKASHVICQRATRFKIRSVSGASAGAMFDVVES